MYALTINTVATAYDRAVQAILDRGEPRTTEDGQKTLEVDNMIIEIKDVNDLRVSKRYPFGSNYIEKYTEKLILGSDDNFVYDYHTRLYHNTIHGEYPFNQIKAIVEKLQKNMNTRRAVAVTWDMRLDNFRKDVPCLQYVQFTINEQKEMKMTVLFRSNDIGLAFHANALGLIQLGHNVADELEGVKFKRYIHHAVNAHVYHERDKDMLNKWWSVNNE